MKNCFYLIFFLVLLSCSDFHPPKKYDIIQSKIINRSFEQIWQSAVKWSSSNNTPIKNIEPKIGLINLECYFFEGENAYCDCGESGYKQILSKPIGNCNLVISKVSETQTKVTIHVFFNTDLLNSGNQSYIQKVECSSTGNLENQIFNYLIK